MTKSDTLHAASNPQKRAQSLLDRRRTKAKLQRTGCRLHGIHHGKMSGDGTTDLHPCPIGHQFIIYAKLTAHADLFCAVGLLTGERRAGHKLPLDSFFDDR